MSLDLADNEEKQQEQISIENKWLASCYSNKTEIKELLLDVEKDELGVNKMIDNSGTTVGARSR